MKKSWRSEWCVVSSPRVASSVSRKTPTRRRPAPFPLFSSLAHSSSDGPAIQPTRRRLPRGSSAFLAPPQPPKRPPLSDGPCDRTTPPQRVPRAAQLVLPGRRGRLPRPRRSPPRASLTTAAPPARVARRHRVARLFRRPRSRRWRRARQVSASRGTLFGAATAHMRQPLAPKSPPPPRPPRRPPRRPRR